MYLNFYHLKKEPFNITPDPDLLYLSPSHKEALAAAIYGVTQRKGFVAIIGEVGVGKTTIVRSFLERMKGQDLKVIYLFNADISFLGVLKTIYESLGYTAEGNDVFELVSRLHAILVELYQGGTNVVLVIDEAQHLPVETLKSLHMLSNLETATDKLFQVVFSGQPEFETKLRSDPLRQIRQRIVIKVRILPLSRRESRAYIEHRLAKTARRDAKLFSAGALRIIVGKAGGIPRVINTLCDNCLITSYGRQQSKVSARVAREIVAELGGGRSFALHWRHALLGAALAGSVAFLLQLRPAAPPRVAVLPATLAPRPDPLPVRVPQNAAAPAPPAGPMEARHPPSEGVGPTRQEHAAGTRIVKRGDTLARLVLDRYGFVDRKLIQKVKSSNPEIVDENLIQEGSSIYFPPLR